MKYRMWLSIVTLTAAITAFSLAAAGQTPKPATPTKAAPKPAPAAKAPWTAPKTPWGDPDLQGVWNDATSTPLQRPTGVKEKDVLSDEEAAEFAQQLEYQLSRDRRDGGADVDVNRAYNEHWMDARRLKITEDRRTSLIVDPPDGRIPPTVPLTPVCQKTIVISACPCAASSGPIRRPTFRRSTTTTSRSFKVQDMSSLRRK